MIREYVPYIASGELLAAAAESAIFYVLARPVSWWPAVAASFLTNAVSYGVGSVML